MIVFSEIPAVTYILGAYDGSLFAFLAVTLSALLPVWSSGKLDAYNFRSVTS
jgi:hypothetical protein